MKRRMIKRKKTKINFWQNEIEWNLAKQVVLDINFEIDDGRVCLHYFVDSHKSMLCLKNVNEEWGSKFTGSFRGIVL